jgi:hypothetical protein
MGPGASCQATPEPHCELMPCEGESMPVCESGGRVRDCTDGRLTWWECGGSFVCAPDRTADGVVCIPPGATPSSRGSLLEESIACTGPTTVRQQRGGYEWVQTCEAAVIRIEDEFVSVPTSCLARDGLAACNPGVEHRSGCEGSGWSCTAAGAIFCNAGVWEQYPCAIGCDPDTSRCVAPLACDPAAGGGLCLDPAVAASCEDGDGDGSGFIARVACPGGCTEAGGFTCR